MDSAAKDSSSSANVWSIGIYAGDSPLRLSPHPEVANPVLTHRQVTDVAASFVADPFLLRAGAEWHMFFEVMSSASGKGEIGAAVSSDGLHWKYRQIVLREPFHLSYPYVFRHTDYYMIPESHQDGAIRLYRAAAFPTEWLYVGALIPGSYVDPSIFFFAGRWWLYACSAPLAHDQLKLFYADELKGPWHEHPKSPIVMADPRRARPAGRVLVRRDQVIRFAQDCIPEYGACVRAFIVTELTPTGYREHEADFSPILTPQPAGWNSAGMHHVDACRLDDGRWIAAVDGHLRDLTQPESP